MENITTQTSFTLNLAQTLGVVVFFFAIALSLFVYLRKQKKTNAYLSAVFLMFALIQLFSVLYDLGLKKPATYFISVFVGARLFLPPIIFLYLQKLTSRKSILLKKNLGIPFFFFISTLVLTVLVNFISKENREHSLLHTLLTSFTLISHFIVFNLLCFFYVYKSFKLLKEYSTYIGNNYSFEEGINLKWTNLFLWGFLVYALYFSISDIWMDTFPEWIYNSSLLIYLLFIGYHGLNQADIILTPDIKHNTLDNIEEPSTETESSSKPPEEKELNRSVELFELIKQLIETEQLYLNTELSINDVATHLNTNHKYISQSINMCYQNNFVTFINSYRIEHAKRLLNNPDKKNLTIEAIGQESGFKSKSAFNNAFKKITGINPSDYKRNKSNA